MSAYREFVIVLHSIERARKHKEESRSFDSLRIDQDESFGARDERLIF